MKERVKNYKRDRRTKLSNPCLHIFHIVFIVKVDGLMCEIISIALLFVVLYFCFSFVSHFFLDLNFIC